MQTNHYKTPKYEYWKKTPMLHRLFTNNELKSLDLALISADIKKDKDFNIF